MKIRSRSALSYLRFRHLLLIEQLIHSGTLRKAAKELNISQPAASGMLNDIESLFDLPLFTRTRQGVLPTPQTLTLAPRIRTLLNEFDAFADLIDQAGAGSGETLRIGVVPHAFTGILPKAITHFQQTGGCALRTSQGTERDLIERLLSGQEDAVVGRIPTDNHSLNSSLAVLNCVNLYEDEVSIVVGTHHPVAGDEKIGFEDLVKLSWVMQRTTSSVRRALIESFLRKGFLLPEPVVETSSYIQSLTLVAGSLLCTAMPRRAALVYEDLGQVKILNVKLDVKLMPVALIMRKTSEQHSHLQRFQESLILCIGIPPVN